MNENYEQFLEEKITIVGICSDVKVSNTLPIAIAEYPDFEIVAQFYSGKDALAKCGDLKPDIIIVDTDVDIGGITLLKALLEICPSSGFIASTANFDPAWIQQVMLLGVRFFVSKPYHFDKEQVHDAIRNVLANKKL